MVRLSLGTFAVLIIATAVSAQPAQPATDLTQIAGSWEGTLLNSGQRYPMTLTIHEDGTWASVVVGIKGGPNFAGTVRVSGGKFRYRSSSNNIEGTYTLREGDGKRVLELLNDPHTTSATFTPTFTPKP